MNITFVIPYFYPAWQYGGQPRSAYELARALVRRGHRVKVLTTDSDGERRLLFSEGERDRRAIDGIDVIYYKNISNALAYRQRIFWSPQMLRNLRHELQGSDIAHLHELRSTIAVPAYNAIRSLSLPYVISTHGGLRHLGKKAVKVVYDAIWGARILREASAVIAISPVEESDAIRMEVGRQKIRRLPNAVSPADYSVLPEAGRFRNRYGIGSERIILFLGRLHWIKGADLLIRSLQRVAKVDRVARLVIAGPDDGQEKELRNLVSEAGLHGRVVFTGFLDHTAKLEAFVDADLLALPSRSEVFAMTAVEALLCGCPILMSDACGLDPMPGPEHGALLYRNEDLEDLIAKLTGMLGNDSIKRYAENGRQFVIREFGPDRVGQQAENIYTEVLRLGERVVS